jgi:hypothetical protein
MAVRLRPEETADRSPQSTDENADPPFILSMTRFRNPLMDIFIEGIDARGRRRARGESVSTKLPPAPGGIELSAPAAEVRPFGRTCNQPLFRNT